MAIDRDRQVPSRMNTLARVSQTQPKTATPREEGPRPSQVDHSRDETQGQIGTQAWPDRPSQSEMELKAMHYRMDMANRHKRPSTQPLMALKQRKLVAKCEFGQQLYTFYEGHGPTCPECGSFMQTISEIGE